MSATTRSGSPRCSASHSVSTSTAARVLAPPTARTALHVLTLCHPNFGLSGLRLGVTGNQTSRCEPARRGRAMGEGEAPEAEISVRGLTKAFGAQTVLEDITCDIPKGKITLMLGPSGTGKSVFLKCIMGLLHLERGEIWISGQNLPALSRRDLYKVRRRFGVLFQDGALFGSISIYDNIAFPLREHTRKSESEIRQIVNEKLDMVGLGGAEKKLPGEISGGMRKRAGLARGLVVTHDIATARRVADYIVMLYLRNLVQFDTKEAMFNSDLPVVRQFLAGSTKGPIGMSEEADQTKPTSTSGMSYEETEELERVAGAPDENGHADGNGHAEAFGLKRGA